ncbi:type VI secretion system amidase effector protein Tae4 [Herbaspirillum sp. RTI4]|uniref:type VI secretion system amidase effector protein Tae4 n=1 Tax=Herbaspirillum sp. RTI4 TaxID=3048640 RepID=UPI002AB4C0C9|nr:type VI secretion system amidase effector protein Tae4 [Herbaspirillum sp. RTI4]MDY7577153.1 type VI secretion system amidase effector protein Tae4 [Herbaspirillum sp. RTI4]MEA9980443.1 type VI secretion system amidase effector protein Tae4 [Herbaspirillum sp. RTI4]
MTHPKFPFYLFPPLPTQPTAHAKICTPYLLARWQAYTGRRRPFAENEGAENTCFSIACKQVFTLEDIHLTKPAFVMAWAASQKIYSPSNPGEKVAQIVGGEVAANIQDKKNPWRNTCAVRMSYILNQSGVIIPATPGKTKKGSDHRHYFYRVRDVIAFLKFRWGAPQVLAYPPAGGRSFAGKKGVILFEVHGWTDASGHATLFNGTSCYDHCYFNEPGVTYRTSQAHFWPLK